MLEYELIYVKPYGDDKQVLSFNIPSPYEALSIIQTVYCNLDDINLFIQSIEALINNNVPDYSEEGGIEFQPILFGSKKSKIAKYVDGKIIGGQEFDTKEFLDVCNGWRDFLKERK